jgi:hypothetical protein
MLTQHYLTLAGRSPATTIQRRAHSAMSAAAAIKKAPRSAPVLVKAKAVWVGAVSMREFLHSVHVQPVEVTLQPSREWAPTVEWPR